jgi:hypothetical protein
VSLAGRKGRVNVSHSLENCVTVFEMSRVAILVTALQFLAILAVQTIAIGQDTSVSSGSKDEGELSFCRFGPKLKVLSPTVAGEGMGAAGSALSQASQGSPTSPDKCSGTAKIQDVLWECNQPSKISTTLDRFRRKIAEDAKAECELHCSRRASGCKGKFVMPAKCGLETDREDAVELGKRLGCRSDCEGKAFIYCSLLNAGYKSEDPELIAKQKPNCRCEPAPEDR